MERLDAAGSRVGGSYAIEGGFDRSGEMPYSAFSGRGALGGGIAPARSFRTTFSHVSRPVLTSVTSRVSSVSPAIFSLWL